jgi:ketosteroid isomerase-like protein
MRRELCSLAIIGVLGALLACGGSGPREFGRTDTDAIRKMTQDFQAAYNAKDAAKLATFFSGAGVLMPPNSSAVRGPDAIRGYYEVRFGEGATDLNLQPNEINGQGSIAYMSGTYSFRNAPEGGPDTRDRGKFLWIVRLLPGNNWRYEIQMWSSDLPPPVPPPPTEEEKK